MNDQSLKQLLQAAEPTGGTERLPSLSAAQLLAGLRRRRARASVQRTSLVVAVGVAIAAAALWPRPDAAPRQSVAAGPSVDQLRAELASLDRQAGWHTAIVAAVTAPSLSEEPSSRVSVEPALWQAEANRSAAISWQHAALVERQGADAATAEAEYRRVIQRFPDTTWAALAADSLRRLSPTGEPSSL